MTAVPNREELRKNWFAVLGRDFERNVLRSKKAYVCDSHFSKKKKQKRSKIEVPKPLSKVMGKRKRGLEEEREESSFDEKEEAEEGEEDEEEAEEKEEEDKEEEEGSDIFGNLDEFVPSGDEDSESLDIDNRESLDENLPPDYVIVAWDCLSEILSICRQCGSVDTLVTPVKRGACLNVMI
uniref:THAP-type domain-containing protein n=1 Tax=Caenorhabditis japonica TaxID=281687 RepID=A0A8R1HSR8_CAEJA